ncbi:MAG: hypothetical protein WC607_05050 [Candidatus Micrarchaeia archaeon]
MTLEHRRQIVHLLFGVALLVTGALYGLETLTALLVAAFALGLLAIAAWSMGFRPNLVRICLETFERNTARFPGQGALMFVTGALFLALFSGSLAFTLAVLAILSFGDGFATLAGVAGKHKLWFNPSKTWEGLVAFFCAGAIAAAFFVPLQAAAFYAAFLSVIEAVGLPADDNILIPVAAVVMRSLVGG